MGLAGSLNMNDSFSCAIGARPPCRMCQFCFWKSRGGNILDVPTNHAFPVPLTETKRLCAIHPMSVKVAAKGQTRPVARQVGSMMALSTATLASTDASQLSLGMQRLQRFLRLLNHMDTAPWASVVFSVNDRMIRRLTASHLHLIVGQKEFNANDRSEMYHLIDSSLRLDGCQNLVWITNRQQGKTSTMGKFLAALSIASPVGGQLCNIYSVSLDRAIELMKSAKEYVSWMMTDAGRHPEWTKMRYTKNNYNTYTLQATPGGVENAVASKPKSPDSCRGDAPSAAFFDEIGFISEAFWYKFALPLLQITQRVATCTTTPPPAESFFAVFADTVKKRNAIGDNFFYLENHSLACEKCIEQLEADKCCHHLDYIPP